MSYRFSSALGLAALVGLCGCVTGRHALGHKAPVEFAPVEVKGDLELAKLNDEELFAGGTSAFAAGDFKKAARYFGRIADFFPQSPHRNAALYNAGLSHEKLSEWEEAYIRFVELGDPAHGHDDALDAAFRVAEALYHLERFDDCATTLEVIAERTDISKNKQMEAQVQDGVCLLEAGKSEAAEASLRKAIAAWMDLENKDEVDDYFPAQAQFFLGEVYRQHFESVQLDASKGTDQLAKDLEYKCELLLSAQGHFLRAIRIGNGYWATAAGAQVGTLYEGLYQQMVNAPVPPELKSDEAEVYREELRKKIRVLLTKSINIYERTLETAERIGAQNAFVERTKASLKKMKDLLLADAQKDDPGSTPNEAAASSTEESDPKDDGGSPTAVPHS